MSIVEARRTHRAVRPRLIGGEVAVLVGDELACDGADARTSACELGVLQIPANVHAKEVLKRRSTVSEKRDTREGAIEQLRGTRLSLTHKTVSFVSWLNASGTVPLIGFPSKPKVSSSVI